MHNVCFSGILLLKKLTVSAAFVDQKPDFVDHGTPRPYKEPSSTPPQEMLTELPAPEGEGLGVGSVISISA